MAPTTILISDDPREPVFRQRLVDMLGAEDARQLVGWVHETHRSQGITFADALSIVLNGIDRQGLSFAHNLLEVAWKPRDVREAEMEILDWARPRIERAAATVLGHRGDAVVAKREFADLAVELMEKLHRLFPDSHEATLRGAVVLALKHEGGQFTLNVAELVTAARTPVPWPH